MTEIVAKKKEHSCEQMSCAPMGDKMGICQIESMVSIDDCGQMVLPKDIRAKMNIKAGDKLTLVTWTGKNKATSVSLIKAEELNELISAFYKNHPEN